MSVASLSLKEAAGFVEPPVLARVREQIRARVSGVREEVDRRGFRLLQWPSRRSNERHKPCELSLEHEARLELTNATAGDRFLRALYGHLEVPFGEWISFTPAAIAALKTRHYDRNPGAQSVDRYYDASANPSQWTVIPQGVTVRERITTSDFMTWSGATSGGGMAPLNLELPSVALGQGGMTARLEFNWIDDLRHCWSEVHENAALDEGNPLALAQAFHGASFGELVPVLHHTTHRQKFGFHEPSGQERFVLNVDLMAAQSLANGRIAAVWDVDISSVRVIDVAELSALSEFVTWLASTFGLQPRRGTKAWNDAVALDLLAV